ncbi:MAG: hypothetical protein J6A75_11995 [Lachnospiraceae bacterium]|nr:hypothetical protein [Lachnospiraceae bacterium]
MSKITAEQLFEAIGEVKEEYLKEAEDKKSKNTGLKGFNFIRKWKAAAMMAACLAVLVIGIKGMQGIRESVPPAECCFGSIIGEIVGDTYYCVVNDKGLYAYHISDGKLEKAVENISYGEYVVNTYGIYYFKDKKVYRKDAKTGETKEIFSAGPIADIRVYLSAMENTEDVLFEVYNYTTETIYEKVIDGCTGADITEQYPSVHAEKFSFEEDERQNELKNYNIGDRQFRYEVVYTLEEDGIWRSTELFYEKKDNHWLLLTPETEAGEKYYSYVEYMDENKMIVEYELYGSQKVLYTADGRDIILPGEIGYNSIDAVVGDYILYGVDSEDGDCKPMVYDTVTKESWQLECYADMSCKEMCTKKQQSYLYNYTSDGNYVFSCAPWETKHALWKMNYDENGRPISVSLLKIVDIK